MEIVPGVHWLKAGYANVYLCVENDGLALVDSGAPRQARKILAYIEQLGYSPSHLKQILITHADWDHAGSAADLQMRTGATVVAAPATCSYLQRGRAPKHSPQPLAFLIDLLGRFRAIPLDALSPAPAGSALPILEELHVLATAGHTPDHHAFFSPTRGVLFAGDSLDTRSGRLGLPSTFITADVDLARRSALRLLQLAPAVFACGHGDPLLSHSSEALIQFQKELDLA